MTRTMSASTCAGVVVPRQEDPERHAALVRHVSALWGKPSVDIRECRTCGFGFADPFVAGDVEYYRLSYLRTHYPAMKWEYRRTLEALSKFPRAERVIELGAGNGSFLDLIADKHVPREGVFATEYNPASVADLGSRGFTMVDPGVWSRPAADCEARRFDWIFMFQVLEHMDDMRAVLAGLAKLLRAGGSLFVAVPNKARIDFNEAHGGLPDVPPAHIGRWTGEAFRRSASRAGLAVVAVEVEPVAFGRFALGECYRGHRERAMLPRSLAGRIRGLPNGRVRKAAIAIEALAFAPTRLPMLRAAYPLRGSLGAHLWVHMRHAR